MGNAESRPRWALILGASSGFGAATARALAADGVNIFGVHLDRRSTMPGVRDLIAELESAGVGVQFFNSNAADAGKRATVIEAMGEQLARDGGTLTVLLHSLAFGTLVPFVDDPRTEPGKTLTQRQMEMTLDVMAHSLVYWTQDVVAAGLMEQGARVFAMTSSGARLISPSYGAVSAAKSALESHCRQLAYELLPRGIAVNSICAGVTDTAALRKIPGHELLIAKSVAKSPLDRLTTPEDVGGAIAALCDPRLGWMTGNVLGIHGGEDIIG